MQKLKYTLFTLLLTLPIASFAQIIDNTLSFKNIPSDRYIRLNYENDFFSATDIYYTQGLHAELVAPFIKSNPVNKLLLHPSYRDIKYGIAAEHEGYTPTTIRQDSILHGNRPFAACLFLKTFLIATDEEKKQRFSTILSTGLIGAAAGAKEMQTEIHRWLKGVHPHGWQNQLINDLILNYQVEYEKQLLSVNKIFSLDADAVLRVGTLSDKAAIGITIMGGYFDSPFANTISGKRNFRIYAYEHPEINIVGYDATLQGGVFNHSSPYTIDADNISRVVLQNRFGFVVQYGHLNLEYFQSYLSREFNTGNYHVWGGIQIAYCL